MLKDFFRRLFFRRSTAYFLVSFVSACTQIILRSALYVTDGDGARRRGVEVYQTSSNATSSLYRLLSGNNLESCPDVPGPCDYLVNIDSIQTKCDMLASYVVDSFRHNRLEDLVFIVLHTYLVLVSIYALARESIPHIIFLFISHSLSTVWALARVIETFVFQKAVVKLTARSKCASGIPGDLEAAFFGQSFFTRLHAFEVALLVVSLFSVVFEAYMANKLCHIYSERPWRLVQVSSKMRRMYRLLLGFSVVVQIAGIVLPATMGLWVDQLLKTRFRHIVGANRPIYETVFLFLAIFLPMWIALGWYALRREWKRSTDLFLGLGFIFMATFIAGLGSSMFKWTIATWQFFKTLYVISLILLVAAIVLAILCRRNFDKNLDHYLMVQHRLSDTNFPLDHFEKDQKMDKCQMVELDLETHHGSEEERQTGDFPTVPK